MQCEQAEQFFDAYLNGELSPALATELGAHRVHCAQCRRSLALLEVSGHIIAADRDEVCLDDGFSDRLIACVDGGRTARFARRFRQWTYIGIPLAAAAVVAMAFLGVFDVGGDGQVAGQREVGLPHGVRPVGDMATELPFQPSDTDELDPQTRALEQWLEKTHTNVEEGVEQSGQIKDRLDMTVLQLLDVLEEAKRSSERTAPMAEPGESGRGAEDDEADSENAPPQASDPR